MRSSLAFGVAILAVATTGCATTLSTLQTANPTDVGQVQITGGMGAYLNVGPAVTLIEQGVKQAGAITEAQKKGEPYALSEEDQQALLTAGVAIAIAPPSTGYEIGVRTGIFEDVDVGFRYSVNAIRLDGKYRFYHHDNGPDVRPIKRRDFDVAIGLGVSRYLFDNPVMDVLDYVELADFSRWDVEVPLIASLEFGEILQLYGAAKYLYSRTSLDANLVNYSAEATEIIGRDVGLPSVVNTHFFGATVGVGAGYKWVHVMLELTGGYTHSQPILFGQRRNLGGATFYPAAGIGVKFP
ncbi:MAG: hypothetical protein WBV82_05530 [Myxococcaceae bacterium]